jgi:hypothetical protein
VLGVLVAILYLDRVAPCSGLLRQRDVPQIISLGAAVIPAGRMRSLSVLVVEGHSSAFATSRRPSSLRPCIPVPHFIHSGDSFAAVATAAKLQLSSFKMG